MSGSALEFVSLGRRSATSDVAATSRALADAVAASGLVAARPSAAQDGNVIVVTAATAARYGLRSIADLAGGSGCRAATPGGRRSAGPRGDRTEPGMNPDRNGPRRGDQ